MVACEYILCKYTVCMSNPDGPDAFKPPQDPPVVLPLDEIDWHLTAPGKSINDIEDPFERLAILWTVVSQYRASSEMQRREGDDGLNYNDARHYQLVELWTHEARRVVPNLRNDRRFTSFHAEHVQGLLGVGKSLEAYAFLVSERTEAPEMLHADIRFDLLLRIAQILHGSDEEDQQNTASLLVRDLADETVPGGPGYCDDAERLRRYLLMGDLDDKYGYLFSDYFEYPTQPSSPSHFDYAQDRHEILHVIASRNYADVAEALVAGEFVSVDEEFVLLPALKGFSAD